MSNPLQFETPENVQIEHRLAGPGTRYLAWFVDGFLVNLLIIMLVVGLIVMGALSEQLFRDLFEKARRAVDEQGADVRPETIMTYFAGIAMLVFGLGSFIYYGLFELLWRGQTPGKHLCRIRVVKVNGFALDAASVFVRNLFRLVDHLPPLWIVPFLSKRCQRFGDMVAGTIVISDEAEDLTEIREELSKRTAAEARFSFDNTKLMRLSHDDYDTIEQVLDRWADLDDDQRTHLLDRMVGPLCKKLKTEQPPEAERIAFLEDLLAAEFRRQDRHLR